MTVINTNIGALRAQNGSRTAQSMLQTAMERLSTGKRINSAKDDAAGLAIASRMTSQIKGLAVAIRNANDGISLAQTAEGALGEVTNMLQRMKELAVQSANGTLGSSERSALQTETNQLVQQINDIARTTNFNGTNLLDGSTKSITLQTGSRAGDIVSLDMTATSTNNLGLTNGAAPGQFISGRIGAASATVTAAQVLFNGLQILSADLALTGTDNAKTLAAGVNAFSDKSGIKATAINNVTSAAITQTTFAAGDVVIGGKAVGAAATLEDLVQNINTNDYGVTATINADNTLTLSNSTGADIQAGGVVFGAAGASGTAQAGFVSYQNQSGKVVAVSGTDTADVGLNNTTDGVTFVGSAAVGTTAALAGNLQLNGTTIGASVAGANATASGAAIAAKINELTYKTGVTATSAAGVITLKSADGSPVRIEGGSDIATLNLRAQGGTSQNSGTLDISSQPAASAALTVIDKALDVLSAKRGDLGAIQNRLDVTVNNLTSISTNLEDARSRIEDTDFSKETTNLAKAQILSQAATAMLAQANQSGQNVLKLLQ